MIRRPSPSRWSPWSAVASGAAQSPRMGVQLAPTTPYVYAVVQQVWEKFVAGHGDGEGGVHDALPRQAQDRQRISLTTPRASSTVKLWYLKTDMQGFDFDALVDAADMRSGRAAVRHGVRCMRQSTLARTTILFAPISVDAGAGSVSCGRRTYQSNATASSGSDAGHEIRSRQILKMSPCNRRAEEKGKCTGRRLLEAASARCRRRGGVADGEPKRRRFCSLSPMAQALGRAARRVLLAHFGDTATSIRLLLDASASSGVRPPGGGSARRARARRPGSSSVDVGVVPRGSATGATALTNATACRKFLAVNFMRQKYLILPPLFRLASASPRGSRGFPVRPRRRRARRRRPAASTGLVVQPAGMADLFLRRLRHRSLGTKLCAALTSARVMSVR